MKNTPIVLIAATALCSKFPCPTTANVVNLKRTGIVEPAPLTQTTKYGDYCCPHPVISSCQSGILRHEFIFGSAYRASPHGAYG